MKKFGMLAQGKEGFLRGGFQASNCPQLAAGGEGKQAGKLLKAAGKLLFALCLLLVTALWPQAGQSSCTSEIGCLRCFYGHCLVASGPGYCECYWFISNGYLQCMASSSCKLA